MDGFELARRIRARRRPRTHLVKPLEVGALEVVLARILGSPPPPAGGA